ncbi:MAG: hypothetical protein NTU88_08055 [Armatimonadetes bacterium]|nr:hypothetical protein [Armatimonadota bacterium]
MFDWLSNSHITASVTIWVAAIGTLAIYSILYKENPVYRMAEHIFIGAAAGYGVFVTWTQILKPQWWDKITHGEWYWIFALIAGSMFYFIYSKKHVWISRIIFGTLLGLIAGAAFKGFAGINIDRIHASFKPLHGAGMTAGEIANNAVFIVVLLAVMAYFFFSFEHRSRLTSAPSKLGRWFLMFAFGAMFGSTVMARMSLLIGRMYFLLHDCLGIAR